MSGRARCPKRWSRTSRTTSRRSPPICRPAIAIELGGTAETSAESQAAVFAVVPLMIFIMLTLLMIQLQNFAQVGIW